KTVIITIVIVIAAIYIWSEYSDSNNEVDVERFENGVKLTLESDRVSDLLWWSDSQRLLFREDDYICTVTTDGDDFSDLFQGENPVISADGKEVFFTDVFMSQDLNNDTYQITVNILALNAIEDNLRVLGEFDVISSNDRVEVAISPNGKWIATNMKENIQPSYLPENTIIQIDHHKIWNIETGEEIIDLLMHSGDMQWNHDGSRLVIRGAIIDNPLHESYTTNEFEEGIWVIDMGSGEVMNISSGFTVNDEPIMNLTSPVWSPDSTKIVFSTLNYFSQKDFNNSIWIAKADASGGEILTSRGVCHHHDGLYDWSPDGTQIALVSCVSDSDLSTMMRQEIRVVDIDGTNGEMLFSLSPDKDLISRIQWSPDGTRIAFSTTTRSDLTTDIYLVDVH
ncbi:MAG: hypothetical protein GY845_02225, partial [Planctomycetes bacterium]|nr:hypothetical protein [Planctomycetota bacterium]